MLDKHYTYWEGDFFTLLVTGNRKLFWSFDLFKKITCNDVTITSTTECFFYSLKKYGFSYFSELLLAILHDTRKTFNRNREKESCIKKENQYRSNIWLCSWGEMDVPVEPHDTKYLKNYGLYVLFACASLCTTCCKIFYW